MSRDGEPTFQCLNSLSVEKSFLVSNLNLPGNCSKEVWSRKAGLTSLQPASPRNSRTPVLSCASITFSHPHIYAHNRFQQIRFSSTFTDENPISPSERKEVDYEKFMCPSVGDVTLWLESAKSTEMFYNQIPNLLQSERVEEPYALQKYTSFATHFCATAQRVTVL